jgi:hypothetical protein
MVVKTKRGSQMQRRMVIAALPIVIIATLLVSEVAAQAILPVKKSKFYVGPLISSARGIPTSSAATSFTVPDLTCPSSSATTGITFGSGIYSAESNWVSAGGVVAECQAGVPVYSAQVIIDNDVTSLSVTPAAGDTVSTSVNIVPGQTQVTVDDITQGSNTTMTDPAGSLATYLLLGADVDRNPSVTGVPNFGKVKFTNASFNGKAAGKATGVKIADLYSGKVLEVTSSQLTHKGTGFTENFVSSGGTGA